MISAASERLEQYKQDVVFVIYTTVTINEDEECYQVIILQKKEDLSFDLLCFKSVSRIYLDNLCEQIKSPKVSSPIINYQTKFKKKKQSI
jgi:hypothetical protein